MPIPLKYPLGYLRNYKADLDKSMRDCSLKALGGQDCTGRITGFQTGYPITSLITAGLSQERLKFDQTGFRKSGLGNIFVGLGLSSPAPHSPDHADEIKQLQDRCDQGSDVRQGGGIENRVYAALLVISNDDPGFNQ
jgi:hypothetical protein